MRGEPGIKPVIRAYAVMRRAEAGWHESAGRLYFVLAGRRDDYQMYSAHQIVRDCCGCGLCYCRLQFVLPLLERINA